eukprot:CAMPEP_0184857028 /NCGR_PEP_ID=MMETSP0580-20130426/2197_1 /TAXON_ID=1118495 /ORGANISM="Dactyliosolen fragilissimus" /LENGTH=371 /DNA_ID=CAMNT_0027352389 /DNA_START=121 /DNA_END=1236 /DNA_ORIENTATION=+
MNSNETTTATTPQAVVAESSPCEGQNNNNDNNNNKIAEPVAHNDIPADSNLNNNANNTNTNNKSEGVTEITTTNAEINTISQMDSSKPTGTNISNNPNNQNHKENKLEQQQQQQQQQQHNPSLSTSSATTTTTTPSYDFSRPLKKARTAYFIFQDEKRPKVQLEHPGENVGTIARVIGQLWSKLTPAEKEYYQIQSAKERKELSNTLQQMKEAGIEIPNNLTSPSNAATSKTSHASNSISNLVLPVARIRKICRLDTEVRGISKEAVHLLTKAAEHFTSMLGKETAKIAQMQNRRKLLPQDIAEVCSIREAFFFLKDDIRDLVSEQVEDKRKAQQQQQQQQQSNQSNRTADDTNLPIHGTKPLTSYFSTTH